MRLLRVCAAVAAAAAVVVLVATARTLAAGPPVVMVALTSDTNSLMIFSSATPGTVTTFPITGMIAGDTMRGIDFRPSAPGMLYGIAANVTGQLLRLYRINLRTGVATPVAGQTPLLVSSQSWGMGFNPTVDRIRVVSTGDENARLNPTTGLLAGNDVNLTPGGQLVDSVAHSNGLMGVSGTSTAYAISRTTSSLVMLGGINGTPSPNGGVLSTVGPLGVTIAGGSPTGLDFVRDGRLFASIQVGAFTALYEVNPATGAATLVGAIGAGTTPIASIAVYEPKAPLDFDGDGITDATVMRNIGGSWFWFIRQSSSGGLSVINWGLTGDTLVSDDFDRDGRADVSAWRPGAPATWFARPSSTRADSRHCRGDHSATIRARSATTTATVRPTTPSSGTTATGTCCAAPAVCSSKGSASPAIAPRQAISTPMAAPISPCAASSARRACST